MSRVVAIILRGAAPWRRASASRRRLTRLTMQLGAAASEGELARWRAGTLAGGWTHMNAAGAAPTSDECHGAMQAHLELERAVGGYEAASQVDHGTHRALASLLGCDATEIALADSAQRAWSLAFGSLELRAGDRIFCFASEYASNAVSFLQASKRTGARLRVLPMRPCAYASTRCSCRLMSARMSHGFRVPRVIATSPSVGPHNRLDA